jgi:hypothetical protein
MINSLMSRMADAEKLSIPQLQKSIQNGVIPAYVGVPLLQDKLKEARAKAAPQQPAQPPIAQQVLAEAAQHGIDSAPSNLPTQMAGGGIVAFSGEDGSLVEDDDEEYGGMSDSEKALFHKFTSDNSGEYALGDEDEEMPEDMVAIAQHKKGETENRGVGLKHDKKGASEGIQYTSKKHKYEKEIREAAKKAGISEDLFLHMMAKETGGLDNPESARSKAGAMGIAQFMPATAKQYGIDPLDMNQALPAAAKMTSSLLKHYGGDQRLAAMAYNWGQGNVDKWLSTGADPSKVPGETRGYLRAAEGGIMKLAEGGAVKYYGNPKKNPDEDQVVEDEDSFIDPGTAALLAPAGYQLGKDVLKNAKRLPPGALSGAPTAIGRTLGSAGKAYLGAAGETALPAAAVGYGGYKLSQAAARTMARPEMAENRKALQDNSMLGAMSGDTAFASAILDAAQNNPKAAENKPAPAPAAPTTTANQLDNTKTYLSETDNEKQAAADAAKIEERKAMGAGDEDIASLREMLDERSKSLKNQKSIDNYMALLQAGLGMMGGTSPYAMANIGQGASKGIAALTDARKSQIAEENALLSGRLGLSRAQLYEKSRRDQLARNIANDKYMRDYRNNMYGLNVSKAMQTESHNKNITNLKARELYDKNGGDVGLRQQFVKQYGKNWEDDPRHLQLFKLKRNEAISDYLGDASAILGGGPPNASTL